MIIAQQEKTWSAMDDIKIDYLNNDLKQTIALKPQIRNVYDVQKYTGGFMADLSDQLDHVEAYFEYTKLK